MKSMVELSHAFLLPSLHPGAICVDATLGHGKDAKYFLEHNVLKVIGFEIQKDVYEETKQMIQNKRFYPYLMGHEKMDEVISSSVDCMIFNFGYCPGKNESIHTNEETSLEAVQKGLKLLKRKGRMALVLYPHEEGKKEAKAIEEWASHLDGNQYAVIKNQLLNQENCPYFIGIEKK